MEAMDMGGGQMMPMAANWSLGYGALVFIMWSVMMVAMMLPSAAPITLLIATVAGRQSGANSRGLTALFVAGYLAVWVGFSTVATALQWALDQARLLSPTMAVNNKSFAAGMLIAVGLYQWTPWKTACLRHCRSPLDFILFHWRSSASGAFLSGAEHGLYCLGCCWMLMALLFVGGVMSIFWIGALALLVLVEKTMPWGEWVSRLVGVALTLWGIGSLVEAF